MKSIHKNNICAEQNRRGWNALDNRSENRCFLWSRWSNKWVASAVAIRPRLNRIWDWLEGGLDINDSARKFTLTRMPGNFSGLHLVSLMFVGSRLIDPGLDSGIDLSKEFAEAEKSAMIM